jgi:hypothetical protein
MDCAEKVGYQMLSLRHGVLDTALFLEAGTIRLEKKPGKVARWINRDLVGEVETPSSDRK